MGVDVDGMDDDDEEWGKDFVVGVTEVEDDGNDGQVDNDDDEGDVDSEDKDVDAVYGGIIVKLTPLPDV